MTKDRRDRTKRGVLQDSFEHAITNPERAERVAGYMADMHGSLSTIKEIAKGVKFGTLPAPVALNATDTGFLFFEPNAAEDKTETPIVVGSSFPDFLTRQMGLDRTVGIDLAANQAYAFGLVVGGINAHRKKVWRTTLRGAVTEGMDETVWPQAFTGSGNAQSIPYRVASTAALRLSGVDVSVFPDFFSGLPENINLDPHLAGLVNPASDRQVSITAQTYLR